MSLKKMLFEWQHMLFQNLCAAFKNVQNSHHAVGANTQHMLAFEL